MHVDRLASFQERSSSWERGENLRERESLNLGESEPVRKEEKGTNDKNKS